MMSVSVPPAAKNQKSRPSGGLRGYIRFFRHEVNENVVQRKAVAADAGMFGPYCSRLWTASWGKPKKPIQATWLTLVTESADKVI